MKKSHQRAREVAKCSKVYEQLSICTLKSHGHRLLQDKQWEW